MSAEWADGAVLSRFIVTVHVCTGVGFLGIMFVLWKEALLSAVRSLRKDSSALPLTSVVVSCPEEGTLNQDGSGPYDQEVMGKIMELQTKERIKMAFDRAGTSNASREDTDRFREADQLREAEDDGWKLVIRSTLWFQTYSGGVKKALMMVAQERECVLDVICIHGGPITQVEQEEMPRLLGEASESSET